MRIATILLVALGGLTVSLTTAAGPVENVLLVSWDGLRWQELFGGADARLLTPEAKANENVAEVKEEFWADSPEARREILLPWFWGTLAKEGQVFGHTESGSPSVVTNGLNFSYPGYSEILTGVVDPKIDSNAKKNNTNVTVLEWLNQQPGFEGRVAAFASWDVFPYIINAERSGIPVNAGWMPLTVSNDPEHLRFLNQISNETPHYWGGVRFDFTTFHGAVEYVKARKPRLLYVAFGETDDWAHDKRYDMYLASARRTDDYVRRLWELLQSMPQYAGKTALVMTTDHGRGDTMDDWTGHGAKVVGSERIWMALYGAGIPAKGLVEKTPTAQAQVAATVAHLLGKDYQQANAEAAAPLNP